jgi:phage terminase Nu1 subunit (DNA packaging protein)
LALYLPEGEPRGAVCMVVVDVTRLAQALNLQPRRVQYLVKEGMPREARGKYDPVKCMCFYIRYLQGLIDKRSLPRDDQAGEGAARVRLLRAKADIRELEVARERSQLVAVADVEATLNELVEVTTTYIMAVPARLAPDLVGETSRLMVQAKIEKAFKGALSALAKYKLNGSAILR